MHTKNNTQIKTTYLEPGAEHVLAIHKTLDGKDTWIPCGVFTEYKAARVAQDQIVLYGQCGSCKDQFYCAHKGAGRYDCTEFK